MMHQASVHNGKAWRQGLAFWFLLLSIFTHAVVPTGSPLQRVSGSAFSATTADVAIAPERRVSGADTLRASRSHQGGSEGAGDDEPPLLLLGDDRFLPQGPAERAMAPIGTVSLTTSHGGAAPFSARAPPSIRSPA